MVNEYDSNVDIGNRNPLNFCVKTYVGNTKLDVGCTHNVDNLKVNFIINLKDMQQPLMFKMRL